AVAIVSLLTDQPVKADLAMTGEITLRGQVLPVGGIKQKVMAAARVGLSTVILPQRNEPDLDDIPEEIRDSMTFLFAERVDDVFQHALRNGLVPAQAKGAGTDPPKEQEEEAQEQDLEEDMI
ncbi:S16 family serine protease, partial [Chloroflexota bacterium]